MKEKPHKRLTVKELKAFKGFEDYTDEQAEETISTLEKLSILFYKLHMKYKQVSKTFKIAHQQDQKKTKIVTLKHKADERGNHGTGPHAA